MLGFAILRRGKIVAETMLSVSKARWDRSIEQLRLDERVEFGEDDIGLAGGVQRFEPSSTNITTVDLIHRFGGTTSPAAKWPEDPVGPDRDEDRLERMARLLERATKRMAGGRGKQGSSRTGSSSALWSGSVHESSEDAGRGSKLG